MATNIARNLAPTGRMTDVHHTPELQILDQLSEIIGIGV
jgi:hypothetical protein